MEDMLKTIQLLQESKNILLQMVGRVEELQKVVDGLVHVTAVMTVTLQGVCTRTGEPFPPIMEKLTDTYRSHFNKGDDA